MRLVRPTYIEGYVLAVLHHDRHAARLATTWQLEKEKISKVLVDHFHELGIYTVLPFKHSLLIHAQIIYLLRNSQELQEARAQVQKEIARARERKGSRAV